MMRQSEVDLTPWLHISYQLFFLWRYDCNASVCNESPMNLNNSDLQILGFSTSAMNINLKFLHMTYFEVCNIRNIHNIFWLF